VFFSFWQTGKTIAKQKAAEGFYPAGGLLFFCVRRKEAKEDRISNQVGKQKETTANR